VLARPRARATAVVAGGRRLSLRVMLDRLRPAPRAPSPEIRVGSLLLRRVSAAHAEAMRREVVLSLEHLRPWMPWAAAYGGADAGREAAAQFAILAHRQWDGGTEYSYVILDADERLLGTISMMARIGPGGLELGYWLGASHTGRGAVTLAAAALTEAALGLRGVTHAEIHHDPANLRSELVPRRLGYRRVGTRPETPLAPGHTGTLVLWRMDAEEFKTSAARDLLERARGE
jgi:ribosomal-protein-serine acetyltransferase